MAQPWAAGNELGSDGAGRCAHGVRSNFAEYFCNSLLDAEPYLWRIGFRRVCCL